MSFSDLISNATQAMDSSIRQVVRDAIGDFWDTLEPELIAAGMDSRERSYLQDRLAAIGSELAVCLRPGTHNINLSLLTEDELVLATESGEAILAES